MAMDMEMGWEMKDIEGVEMASRRRQRRKANGVDGDWVGDKRESELGSEIEMMRYSQGVTKRCRLSQLTNGALINEPYNRRRWGVAGYQPINTAVHRSPNKLWRSTVTSCIFNLSV